MGWGAGNAKKEVLDVAGSGLLDANITGSPFFNKDVLIDVSGIAHKAAKRSPKQVVLHGTSDAQKDYVLKRIEAVAGEGGRPILQQGSSRTGGSGGGGSSW